MAKLPPKRRAFVNAYLGEAKGNATQAATIAGYKSPAVEGCRLLKDAKVSALIGKRAAVEAEKSGVTREEVMEFLTDVMRGDIGEAWRETNLAGEVVAEGMGPAKPADRIKAAQTIGKFLGMEMRKKSSSMQQFEDLARRDPQQAADRLREMATSLEAQAALKALESGET